MTFVRPLARMLALVLALCAGLAHAQTGPAATLPATLPAATAPAPVWSEAQRQALWNAAQHTAGTTAYEYKAQVFPDIVGARMARASGLRASPVYTAPNLLWVDPTLRLALINLRTPGERSQPLPVNNRGAQRYAVVELVRTRPAVQLQAGLEFEKAAAYWVANGLLPAPETLLTDPKERARAVYWQALTPQAVQAIPMDVSPNVEYGNYLTPLTRGILTGRWDLVLALLDHGADPQLCGVLGCVLHQVVAMSDLAQSTQWLPLLLARGAKPDTVDPRHLISADTALATAIAQDRLTLAEALIKAGASPDGAPGVLHTPLFQAVAHHRKDTVQWLINLGASVLPWTDRDQPQSGDVAHLAAAARSTKDLDFATWAEKTMLDAARAAPQYQFDAFVEQNGKRYRLLDGAAPKIKAAPFRLVLVLPPGASNSVTIGASFENSWTDEVRKGDLRNPLFRLYSAAALAEPPNEGSYDLLVGQSCPTETKANEPCPGVKFVLQTNANVRKDFHSIRTAAHEYIREVRQIYDVATTQEPTAPIEKFRGKTLQLVLSTVLNMGGIEGVRLINPRYVLLLLQ